MSLFDLFLKGGVVMWPILGCSLIVLVVIIERWLALRRAHIDVGQFMMRLRSVLQRGGVQHAIGFCVKTQAPLANVMRKGLAAVLQGHERVRDAIENARKEERFKLEHRLGMLANVAGVAPLLGFLGTVTGMIAAFRTVEQLGRSATTGDFASGIWEALLTTAFGLVVGIPALAFYNYLLSGVNYFVFELERASEEFLELVRSGDLGVEDRSEIGQPGGGGKYPDQEFFKKKA